jgi:hypothetical protein
VSCSQNIKRRSKYTGGESRSKSTRQIAWGGICHESFIQDDLLVLIVTCQLGTVDYTVSDNVGAPRSPKTLDAFVLYYFTIAVESSVVICSICSRICLFSLVLQSHFDNVSRVGHCYSYSTCYDGRSHFLYQSWILTIGQLSSNCVSYWEIHSNS